MTWPKEVFRQHFVVQRKQVGERGGGLFPEIDMSLKENCQCLSIGKWQN